MPAKSFCSQRELVAAVIIIACVRIGIAFPPGDELGAANYLQNVNPSSLAAFFTARSKYYSLGLDVRHDDPAFGTRQCVMVVTSTTMNSFGYLDDVLLPCAMGVGSQLDGLAHVHYDGVFYNGFKADEILSTGIVANKAYNTTNQYLSTLPETLQYSYLKKLGVDKVPPIVTRAVLLNMVDVFSRTSPENVSVTGGHRHLTMGTGIEEKHVKKALAMQGLNIKEGDVVLIHTGWLHLYRIDNSFITGEPGITLDAANFLVSNRVVAVGSDNWGLEVAPHKDPGDYPVHVRLLKESGTYILENMDTRALVADRVDEMLFMLGHMKIHGGVQVIVNPVAVGVPRGRL